MEHDAAVADGATRRAGAVTCISGIRNPVLAARAVLDRTPHVLLSGTGAEELARQEGLALVPADWFVTARRREQWARTRLSDREALILSVFAHEVDALVRIAGLDLGAACQQALRETQARSGTGGCIAVAPDGTVAMPFTSAGMFRGAVDATGDRRIGIFAAAPSAEPPCHAVPRPRAESRYSV